MRYSLIAQKTQNVLTDAGPLADAWVGWSVASVSLFVRVRIRTLKEKRLELLTSNLVEIQYITIFIFIHH